MQWYTYCLKKTSDLHTGRGAGIEPTSKTGEWVRIEPIWRQMRLEHEKNQQNADKRHNEPQAVRNWGRRR
ncbi:hypothetical protein NBRC116598_41400 [Pseudophaeobacter arcticus]|uniref:Uncharacterized protein n=1 Tax=Pseudophaeobacter arcticus TaxID=385492 RepID=A0ABQ0AS66_9RHOB